MYSYININELVIDTMTYLKLRKIYTHYCNHEFDLLGSGWQHISYNMEPKGFCKVKYSSLSMSYYGNIARKRLKHKCTSSYIPINWFVDYRSGFFFAPWKYSSWKKCYSIMDKKYGVDIKCPWELGRFYHFVQMAVLAIADESLRENIIIEYKNELNDFIEMNPVGKTVQWTCPMDVSIRVVNLLIAYDIFMQLDKKHYLDKRFQFDFLRHIKDSLDFIIANLEYGGKGAGSNHYLANITGIIFAAAYMPANDWTNACVVFGVQELIEQFAEQFHDEGTNFEGSTSYHRLSTEFILYSTALVYGVLKTDKKRVFGEYCHERIKWLKKEKFQKYDLSDVDFFPKWFVPRLYRAGIFTKTILKSNGEIVQIGDNDSGRLLKLTPMIDTTDNKMEENDLAHGNLLSAMGGIFSSGEFFDWKACLPLESSFISALSGRKLFHGDFGTVKDKKFTNRKIDREKYIYSKETILFQADNKLNYASLLDNACVHSFDKFGIIILRSKRVFISLVIDTARNVFYSGHIHNDKLSIEVMVDGKYITRDPGTYTYTAAPEIRDKFRSARAHNTIYIDGYEQNEFDGIWGMRRKAKAELISYSENEITAKLKYGEIECLRKVILTESRLKIVDFSNRPFHSNFKNTIYSDGYGKLKRVKR